MRAPKRYVGAPCGDCGRRAILRADEEGSAIVAAPLKTDEQQKLAGRSARASF
jgi:hypothetical protein